MRPDDDDLIFNLLLAAFRADAQVEVHYILSWDRPLHMVSRGRVVGVNDDHFTWRRPNGVVATIPCEQVTNVVISDAGMGDIISD